MIHTPYTACLKNLLRNCTYIHIKSYSKKVTGSSIFAKLLVEYKKDVKILILAYYLGKTDYFVHRFYLSQAKTQN